MADMRTAKNNSLVEVQIVICIEIGIDYLLAKDLFLEDRRLPFVFHLRIFVIFSFYLIFSISIWVHRKDLYVWVTLCMIKLVFMIFILIIDGCKCKIDFLNIYKKL